MYENPQINAIEMHRLCVGRQKKIFLHVTYRSNGLCHI